MSNCFLSHYYSTHHQQKFRRSNNKVMAAINLATLHPTRSHSITKSTTTITTSPRLSEEQRSRRSSVLPTDTATNNQSNPTDMATLLIKMRTFASLQLKVMMLVLLTRGLPFSVWSQKSTDTRQDTTITRATSHLMDMATLPTPITPAIPSTRAVITTTQLRKLN
jgi:hypothetical protein